MKCKTCSQELPLDYLAKKAKQKSDRIKQARAEAKANGEQVGAKRKIDYRDVREIKKRHPHLTVRDLARFFGVSTYPIIQALKEQAT